ncbi:MAG: hypothetical protein JNK85_00265 [Verrucomicrobiales bacterium]|nr:hypothetical protein [Verrucomicrobiales bacterium]
MNSAAPIAPKLPTANPVLERASPPATTGSAGNPHPQERSPARRREPMGRNAWRSLGEPRVAWTLITVAVFIVAGSSWFRLPEARRASARVAMASRRTPAATTPAIDPAEFAALRAAAQKAGDRLVANRGEFRDLLTHIEKEALAQGWQIETQVQPATRGPDPLPELVHYPVTAMLATGADRDAPPAFNGLLRWLEGLSNSSKAIEITSIFMMGEPGGLTKARVELRLIGRTDHEFHSKK